MIKLDTDNNILNSSYQYVRTKHNGDKILIFEKDNILFIFNWHPTQSFSSYPIYAQRCKKAQVLWSTDDHQFGGHGRVHYQTYET